MESIINLEDIISKIKYKSGYEFKVFNNKRNDTIEILIRYTTIDSANGGPITLDSLCCITKETLVYNTDIKEFIFSFIRETISRMELHEVDEFLKYDGKHIKDPHPELKNGNYDANRV